MEASKSILSTWRKFDDFPMETLTKAWYFHMGTKRKQREVSLMKEHRFQYGITGNCFDLAIWLLDEFKNDGVESYPIGNDVGTSDAHVAVIALDERGNRYLCDLGDQWLNPILIDSKNDDFTDEKLSGFFPGAQVQIKPIEDDFEVVYHRQNGKVSRQIYKTEPIAHSLFLQAAEFCQNDIYPKPLLEIRTPYKKEIAHWEFYNWESLLSTSEGLIHDQPLGNVEEWVERIHQRTGYNKPFLNKSLQIYQDLS